ELLSGFAGSSVGVRGAKPLAAGRGSASVPPAWAALGAGNNELLSGFAGSSVGVRGAKPLAAGRGSASVPPA
ncbi:MAG: hypothetical protein ACUVRY_07265, partial [Thermoanaerobaculaceae bacterium]